MSDVLSDHERAMGSLFIRMVRSSESIGKLPEVLRSLAEHLEAEAQLTRRIRLALVYPTILVGMGIVTVLVLVTYVVPRLGGLFDELGQELPLLTRWLVGASRSSSTWLPITAAVVALIGFVAARLRHNLGVRRAMDRLRWRVPVLGRLHRAQEVERFARTMHLLIASGAPLLSALATCARSTGSSLVTDGVAQLRSEVAAGGTLGSGMRMAGIFDRSAVQLIAVAEEANDLVGGFERLGQRSRRELDHANRLITTIVEPVLIVGIGLAIAIVVFAMMLPIFRIDISGVS